MRPEGQGLELPARRRASSHQIRAIRNRTRNAKNRILAIAGVAAAIPVKAKAPATKAMIKKIIANLSICISLGIYLLMIGSGEGLVFISCYAAVAAFPSLSI